MALIDGILQELGQEAETTRRLLERVPDEHLAWRPHPKARTLGELALHIALIPGNLAELAKAPSPVPAPQLPDPSPESVEELLTTLDESLAKARASLDGLDDDFLHESWSIVSGEREIFKTTRLQLLRTVMLNHWYHHRGQLSTYLRELDVPIPSIYGPSADENPFA